MHEESIILLAPGGQMYNHNVCVHVCALSAHAQADADGIKRASAVSFTRAFGSTVLAHLPDEPAGYLNVDNSLETRSGSGGGEEGGPASRCATSARTRVDKAFGENLVGSTRQRTCRHTPSPHTDRRLACKSQMHPPESVEEVEAKIRSQKFLSKQPEYIVGTEWHAARVE